jgi:hypothetical protein
LTTGGVVAGLTLVLMQNQGIDLAEPGTDGLFAILLPRQ